MDLVYYKMKERNRGNVKGERENLGIVQKEWEEGTGGGFHQDTLYTWTKIFKE